MRPPWFMTGCHRWKWKLLVLSFLFFVPGVLGQCTVPFQDISNDGSQPRCVAVSTTAVNFARARFQCQQLDPDADLITILSSDNLAQYTGFMQGNYYVGLTEAISPNASSVNVQDCSTYNSTAVQPTMTTAACGQGTCYCWTLNMNGELDQRNCLMEQFGYICGINTDPAPCMCPSGWFAIRDRCYRYYTNNNLTDFDAAQAVCQSEGGFLATTNFYDCNYAAILESRPNASIPYLVGLRGNVSLQWRDLTTPTEVYSTGFAGNCYVLGDNSVYGQLQRTPCDIAVTNFICERNCTFETTMSMQTTADAQTTEGQGTTQGLGSTEAPATTGRGLVTTDAVGDVTTDGDVNVTTPGDVSVETTPADVSVTTPPDVSVTTPPDVSVTTPADVSVTTPANVSDLTTADTATCCPTGSTAIGDNCFAIITTATTYDSAVTSCAGFGGSLARVNPPNEVTQFIIDFFNGQGSSATSLWIGLRRRSNAYFWESDNTELLMSQNFWASGQPQAAAGFDCVIAVNSAGIQGRWFLTNCFAQSPYLCQLMTRTDCRADRCVPNPCDSSGQAPSTCTSTGFDTFQCSCPVGFELQSSTGPCVNTNECLQSPCDAATQDCMDSIGSFSCVCQSGLMEDPQNPGLCITVDLCSGVVCTQGPGAIFCNANGNCQCSAAGFELQTANGPCIDINECTTTPPGCEVTSTTCQNSVGSFQCTCRTGFQTNPATNVNCLPLVDPCTPNPCTAGALNVVQCNPISGACECPTGYTLTATNGPCTDVNECATNNGGCDVTSTTCMNAQGSFTCNCNSGFQDSGLSNACSDINECNTNNGGCQTASTTCMNTPGSFSCQCRSGFQQTGSTTSCTNVNECLNANDNNCDLTTTVCQDNPGSFTCECLGSRVRVSAVACTDECTANTDGCDNATTTCVADANGDSSCSCRSGFVTIPGNPLACQAASTTVCCPTSTDANGFNQISNIAGRCIFHSMSVRGSFSEFDSSMCAQAVSAIGQSGGRLLELADVTALDNQAFVGLVNQSLFPFVFPAVLYVDLSRASSTSDFRWGDTAQTILPSTSSLWLPGSPISSTSDRNCVSLTNTSSAFGYTNVDCGNQNGLALCSLTPISCSQALTARAVIHVTQMNGDDATYNDTLKNQNSTAFAALQNNICVPVTVTLGADGCTLTNAENGSIIAYLEVTITQPNKIGSYEDMKKALTSGPLDENGYVTLYTSDGREIRIDPKYTEVDDIAKYQCQQSTCKNGGTCTYNARFIEANCQCMNGFLGARCEIERDSSNIGLLVVLSILALVLLLVFTCCICCVCLLSRRQNQNQKTFAYQPPTSKPEIFTTPSAMSKTTHGIQRKYREAALDADGEFGRSLYFPRVIRNRGVDRAVEMQEYGHNNSGFEPDDYDVESSIDDKRMDHFKKVFSNASQLNSRMSSRGDSASSVSSESSILKRPLSDTLEPIDERHEFDRPYTTDGTENI